MKLSPAAFNRFLRHIGQDMQWQRAFQCPCRNPHSGAAKPNCTVCKGKGTYWGEAVGGVAGLSGMQVQKQWFNFGLAELGDVVVTIPSDTAMYNIGQFDRVVMTDSTQPFSLTLIRCGAEEFIPFKPVSVDYVTWLDAAGNLQQGGKPSVIENGIPRWSSDGPPEGTVYTVAGRRHQEYFVYQDFPQERAHHHGEPLPRKVVLRKFDLYGR